MKILRIPLVIGMLVVAGRTFHASAQTLTILYSFGNSPDDGVNPWAGLVQGSDSNFYGTTYEGGPSGAAGTVFRISPGGSYTNLYSFGSYLHDGQNPKAGLVQGNDGNFYGTTANAGSGFCSGNGCGTVFRVSPSGTETTLYSFAGSPDGASPWAGLVQGSDGNFYGTTYSGGMYGAAGSVFQISPSGSYTPLYLFLSSPGDGDNPYAGLVQGSDSNFYGTTAYGGTKSVGTVFRISSNGTYVNLYSFGNAPNDGSQPFAGLVLGSDGNFYGTTVSGGTGTSCSGGCGTIFRISPSGSYTNLYSFGNSPTDGQNPSAGLVQGNDSNFYGTTEWGGTNDIPDGGLGTIFRISPSGSYTNLYSFGNSPTDGQNPSAGLVQGNDGNFYGTTYGGGTYGNGTVFELAINGGGSGTNCTFSIGSTNGVFNAAGGPDSVNVTASKGCAWTATSNVGFITITSGSSGSGNGMVGYTVAADTSATGRSGTMSIAGQTFTVTQSGELAETALITVQANPANGGTVSGGGTFTVGSSQQISATANSGWTFAGWSDGGTQTHDITVPAGGITYTASFTASVNPCTYTLNATRISLAAKGGSKSVKVKASSKDCSWIAASNDSFITITETGGTAVKFSVPGNTNTVPMTGTMMIAGQTFTVNQAAGGCTYKLSPKTGKIKAAGGTATVKVTPNFSDCAWTAVSNDPFITITGGTSGTGKGTVTYTVAANTTTNILTGTITVAGETYTITQAGEK